VQQQKQQQKLATQIEQEELFDSALGEWKASRPSASSQVC